MRSAKQLFAFCFSILFAFPGFAQQATTNATPGPLRDPQATTILSQILNGAGGAQAISSVQDLLASGTVSYNWGDTPVQGTVTIKGRGVGQFRLDATLPDGNRTLGINNGQRFTKNPDGTAIVQPYQDPSSFQNILFPWMNLFVALQGPSINISYLGLETRNGTSVQHISIAEGNSGATENIKKARTLDLFVDATTSQLRSLVSVAVSTDLPIQTCSREIAYSDYRPVNGVVVPFSITEFVCGQQTMMIQLTQVSFNTGLSDSDFEYSN